MATQSPSTSPSDLCSITDCESQGSRKEVHIFDIRGMQEQVVRSRVLEVEASMNMRSAVAQRLHTRKKDVVVRVFGDGNGSSVYAVVKGQANTDLLSVLLVGFDERLPVLLSVPPSTPIEDICCMASEAFRDYTSSTLCLLREGHVLTSGTLPDHDIRQWNVLQVVHVTEKVMNVTYYREADMRGKFHPRVSNTATVRDIREALAKEIIVGKLPVDLNSHDILISAGPEMLTDDDFQPHIDVIDTEGNVMSRKLDSKYFTVQFSPRGEPKLEIELTYRRSWMKRMRKRSAVVSVSTDASIKTLRDAIARFVSKPGNSIRLCSSNEEILRLSPHDRVSVVSGMLLYAEPEPAMTVYVHVTSFPPGVETSISAPVYNWDTLTDLREFVAGKLAVDPDLLCFEYAGQEMVQENYLIDYALMDKSKIHCKIYQLGIVISLISEPNSCHQGCRRVLVRDATTTTVEDLERWLKYSTEDNSDLSLVLNGRPLESSLLLAEVGLAKRSKLMVLRSQPVNAVRKPPALCQRAFEVEATGTVLERFLHYPVGKSIPFYASPDTKLNDLEVADTPGPPDPADACKRVEADLLKRIRDLSTTVRERVPLLCSRHSCPAARPEEERTTPVAEGQGCFHGRMCDPVAQSDARRNSELQEPFPCPSPALDQDRGEDRETGLAVSRRGICSDPLEHTLSHYTRSTGESTLASDEEETCRKYYLQPCDSSPGYATDACGSAIDSAQCPESDVLTGVTLGTVGGTDPESDTSSLPTELAPISDEIAGSSVASMLKDFPVPEAAFFSSTSLGAELTNEDVAITDSMARQLSKRVSDGSMCDEDLPKPASESQWCGLALRQLNVGKSDKNETSLLTNVASSQTASNTIISPHDIDHDSSQLSFPQTTDIEKRHRVKRTSEVIFKCPQSADSEMFSEFCIRQSSEEETVTVRSTPPGSPQAMHTTFLTPSNLVSAGTSAMIQVEDALSSIENSSSGDSMDQILKMVAEELSSDWLKVCLDLGVKSQDIEFVRNCHPLDLFNQAFYGLKKWRMAQGRAATVDVLKNCLNKNNLRGIAEKI